jgi:hypothetical protein
LYPGKHPEQQHNKQKKPEERQPAPAPPDLTRERPSRQVLFERPKFPYKTKKEDFERINDANIPADEIKPTFHDKYLPPQKRYDRPSFSPYLNSWVIDLVMTDRANLHYFGCINVNTKYMFMLPIRDKSTRQIERALDFIRERELMWIF